MAVTVNDDILCPHRPDGYTTATGITLVMSVVAVLLVLLLTLLAVFVVVIPAVLLEDLLLLPVEDDTVKALAEDEVELVYVLLVSELPVPVDDEVELPEVLLPVIDCELVELEYVDEDFVLLGDVDAEVTLEVGDTDDDIELLPVATVEVTDDEATVLLLLADTVEVVTDSFSTEDTVDVEPTLEVEEDVA